MSTMEDIAFFEAQQEEEDEEEEEEQQREGMECFSHTQGTVALSGNSSLFRPTCTSIQTQWKARYRSILYRTVASSALLRAASRCP